MRFSILSLFSLVLLLSSCDDDDKDIISSENVSTGRMYATFQVVADGSEDVFVEAQLTLNVPPQNSNDEETFIRLDDDEDELWLSAGESIDDIDLADGDIFGDFEDIFEKHARFEETVSQRDVYTFLFEEVIINEFGTSYSAQLPVSEFGEYRVSLLRDSLSSATDSIVTVPQNFSLTSPIANERYSRSADNILVEWTNVDAAASVQIDVNITCPENDFVSYSSTTETDSGSFTILAGELVTEEISGVCSATLIVRKVNVGQFDSAFIGGAVNGYQVRRRVFLLEN